jgi:hypothetical protein
VRYGGSWNSGTENSTLIKMFSPDESAHRVYDVGFLNFNEYIAAEKEFVNSDL